MISEAQENVKQTTITTCFHQADFKDLFPSQPEYDDILQRGRSPTDEDGSVSVVQLVARLHRSTATEPRIELEEFTEIDDNVAVRALTTEEKTLAEAESNNRNSDEENEDKQDHQEQFQPTTISEVHNTITVLQKFVTFNDQFNTDDILTTMKRKMQNIFETEFKTNRLK